MVFIIFLVLVILMSSVQAEIIFSQKFDASPLGNYSEKDAHNDFPNVDFVQFNSNGPTIIDGSEAYSGRSLRFNIVRKNNTNNQIWFRVPGGGARDIYMSWMMTANTGFSCQAGGKMNGLAGLEYVSGYRSGGCINDGEFHDIVQWNGRGMNQYMFYWGMHDRCKGGEGFWLDGGDGSRKGTGPLLCKFAGEWHHFEIRNKMNTPGQADGILQIWFDGKLIVGNNNIDWVLSNGGKIDRARVSAYTSGSDKPTSGKHYIYYDNIVISTSRQGPPEDRAQKVPSAPSNVSVTTE